MSYHAVIHELDMKSLSVIGDAEDRALEIGNLVDTDRVAVQLLAVAGALVALCRLHDVCSEALMHQVEEAAERRELIAH